MWFCKDSIFVHSLETLIYEIDILWTITSNEKSMEREASWKEGRMGIWIGHRKRHITSISSVSNPLTFISDCSSISYIGIGSYDVGGWRHPRLLWKTTWYPTNEQSTDPCKRWRRRKFRGNTVRWGLGRRKFPGNKVGWGIWSRHRNKQTTFMCNSVGFLKGCLPCPTLKTMGCKDAFHFQLLKDGCQRWVVFGTCTVTVITWTIGSQSNLKWYLTSFKRMASHS